MSGFFIINEYIRVIVFMKNIIKQIAERQIESLSIIRNYTCTLIKNFGNYKVHGTGIFIKIQNLYLLVSAAHVFDDFHELFIPLGSGETLLKPGGKLIINNSKVARSKDDLDIGILILDDISVKDLIQSYDFVMEGNLATNHNITYLHNYIVFGYPSSWSKKSITRNSFHSRPFINFTKCVDLIEYPQLKRNEVLNIIVEYNRQETVNFKSKKFSFGPDLFGISGCGLWYLDPRNYKEKANPKLVGIMTDWPITNRKRLISTRIDAITEILRKSESLNFPESNLFSFK